MSEINNTANIRDWLRTCPAVVSAQYFGADYMGKEPREYAVISVPSTLNYRENILGKRVLREKQEQDFIFASKAPFGDDVEQNLANLGFFQDVVRWIKEQNRLENFPEWDGGNITGIDARTTGAPVARDANSARYQLQIKVNYKIHEERE